MDSQEPLPPPSQEPEPSPEGHPFQERGPSGRLPPQEGASPFPPLPPLPDNLTGISKAPHSGMIRSFTLSSGVEPVIRVQALDHFFGEGEARKQVLFQNELELMPGELVIMTGPSGSGKTTLLTLIGALRRVQQGNVRVLGKELSSFSSSELVKHRQRVGFIFQQHNLFPSLTAYQNVRMALELQDFSWREKRAMAEKILDRLGITHRMHAKPQQLSGGQRQRVAIARALVHRPSIVLADEPTAALDKDTGRQVIDLFKELVTQEKCTILLVTHDPRILDAADRIVGMVDGKIVSNVLVKESIAICEFLKKIDFFKAASPAELSELSQKMKREVFPPGRALVTQGNPGFRFYLIRDGEVEVEVKDASGTKKIVATLGPGAHFGETALMTNQPRNATVRAKGPLEVYTLSRPEFLAAMKKFEAFGEQVREAIFRRT